MICFLTDPSNLATVAVVACLCSSYCYGSWCVQLGCSALMFAADKGHDKVVELLVSNGSTNVNLQCKVELTKSKYSRCFNALTNQSPGALTPPLVSFLLFVKYLYFLFDLARASLIPYWALRLQVLMLSVLHVVFVHGLYRMKKDTLDTLR